MVNKNMYVASQVIEMSETDSYIDLCDRVCYYDHENLNKVQLDYDETSYEKAQTLVNQPVLAYYKVDEHGNPTLGGHEMRIKGGKVSFATQAIGTHLDVKIEDAEVELVDGTVQNVKCLFSTIRLWKRFDKCVSAARSLFEKGKLYNSWEIMPSEVFYDDNNVRHLKEYSFVGNCLLGTAYPAYGKASHVYQTAEKEEEPYLLIAEALTADILASESASNINTNQLDDSKSDREEEVLMDANENVVVENSETVAEEEAVETVEVEETAEAVEVENSNSETPEVSESESVEDSESEADNETDTSSEQSEQDVGDQGEASEMLTDRDISIKIENAYRKKGGDGYVAMVFPEEKLVLIKRWGMNDLKYKQYSYRIDGDEVVLENEQDVELVISPLNINSEIETRNNAIANANNRIVELEKQVAELNVFKQELDTIKAEQENVKHNEAVNKLRKFAVDSGRFTAEEIESDPVKSAIDNLNEAWIKSEVADRFVASLQKDVAEVATTDVQKDALSIVLSEEEKPVTSEDVMRAFFNN